MGTSIDDIDLLFLGKEKQIRAIDGMLDMAKELDIEKGVAFILVWRDHDFHPQITFSVLKLERKPDSARGEMDIGTNYFGVVMSKLAVMLSTKEDSGHLNRPLLFGEVPYEGGITFKFEDNNIYIGFSGGTEAEDVRISYRGMNRLLKS